MKFKLNNRVIWKDDIGRDPLKGTIINLIHDGMTIKWDNGRTIHYNFSLLKEMSYYGNNDSGVGHIEIDLAYHREIKLNQLGI
jgi:hypothetical protein